MTNAEHRFSNALRRRHADAPEQTQITPAYILEAARSALGGTIWLDPCTIQENPVGATVFYTVETDGLAQAWDFPSVWVNPPYGEARIPWVERCIDQGDKGSAVLLLIPAATETRIFQKALRSASVTVFTQGRINFGNPRRNGRQIAASHPSALIGWNVDAQQIAYLGCAVCPLQM